MRWAAASAAFVLSAGLIGPTVQAALIPEEGVASLPGMVRPGRIPLRKADAPRPSGRHHLRRSRSPWHPPPIGFCLPAIVSQT